MSLFQNCNQKQQGNVSFLLGNTNINTSPNNSLFGVKTLTQNPNQTKNQTSLFDQKENKVGSIFDQSKTITQNTQQQQNLFGLQQKTTPFLFNQKENKTGGIFDQTKPLTLNTNQQQNQFMIQQKPAQSIFDFKENKVGSIFDQNKTVSQNPQQQQQNQQTVYPFFQNNGQQQQLDQTQQNQKIEELNNKIQNLEKILSNQINQDQKIKQLEQTVLLLSKFCAVNFKGLCNNGHVLEFTNQQPHNSTCSVCKCKTKEKQIGTYSCNCCNFNRCESCYTKNKIV